jgi:hypothetical protein
VAELKFVSKTLDEFIRWFPSFANGRNPSLDCMIVQVFKARPCDNLINASRRWFSDLVTGRRRRVRFNAV